MHDVILPLGLAVAVAAAALYSVSMALSFWERRNYGEAQNDQA